MNPSGNERKELSCRDWWFTQPLSEQQQGERNNNTQERTRGGEDTPSDASHPYLQSLSRMGDDTRGILVSSSGSAAEGFVTPGSSCNYTGANQHCTTIKTTTSHHYTGQHPNQLNHPQYHMQTTVVLGEDETKEELVQWETGVVEVDDNNKEKQDAASESATSAAKLMSGASSFPPFAAGDKTETAVAEEQIDLATDGLSAAAFNLEKKGGEQTMQQHNEKEEWNRRFVQLMEYVNHHNTCYVPLTYEKCPGLGSWVKGQRERYDCRISGDSTTLSNEQAAALESIGFLHSTVLYSTLGNLMGGVFI